MEEGDGAGEGAADVEAEHVGEEELLHLLVRLPWEGLELGLCVLVSDRKRQKERENNLLKKKKKLAIIFPVKTTRPLTQS